MLAFTTVTGIAAPLLVANIDTDIIIRVERMVGTTKASMGAHAFEVWRRRPDGSDNPDFVLNQPRYRAAAILLAGANFGCGSSREAAVWALAGCGIRAIIAPSFSDIFRENALRNGVLPVVLAEATVRHLAAVADGLGANARTTIDLHRCVVIGADGGEHPFAIDPDRRTALLAGLDEVGVTLRLAEVIAAWQQADRVERGWAWQRAAVPRQT